MSERKTNSEIIGAAARGAVGPGWSAGFLGLACLAILFTNLGSMALFEPDEGRNAEKAREILVLNDWITPHQNFLPTLDKPMGFYWPVALSFKMFGFTEWAARLPSTLSALGCLLLVYQFARRRWGPDAALWSCLVLATSFEFFVFARLVILDMSLTFFLTWALFSFYAVAGASDSRSALFHGAAMYAAIGAGTLVKGPVAVVLPGLVIFAYLLSTRRWSLLRRLNLVRGAIIFLIIVAPWYLWAEANNPGYLRYFLVEEHFLRYVTPEFNRSAGWYYFFLVLAVGFLPWSLALPPMVKYHWKRNADQTRVFLALWVVLPFVFFSLSRSKLPQYILPIYPALALLMGRFLEIRVSCGGAKGAGALTAPWLFMLGNVVYLLLGAARPDILPLPIRDAVANKGLGVIVACGAFLLLSTAIFFIARYRNNWSRRSVPYFSTAVGLVVFCVLLDHMMIAVSRERTAKTLAQAAALYIDPGDRVGFYDTYLTGMAFYLDIDQPLWIVQHEDRDTIMGSNYLAKRLPAADGRGQVVFSFSEFAHEWHRKDLTLRVFVKEKNLQRLNHDVGAPARILTQLDEYILVTNR